MKSRNEAGLQNADVSNTSIATNANRRKPFVAAYKVVLDVIFPHRCAGCRAWHDGLFCAICRAGLQPLGSPLCARCGTPINDMTTVDAGAARRTRDAGTDEVGTLCDECRRYRRDDVRSFDVLRSPFAFEGALRTAIHRFKYEGKTALAAPLAAMLDDFLRRADESSHMSTHVQLAMRRADLLVPVPLHAWRHHRRGYNQSELLARELGRRLDAPVCDALRRTRHTPPQVGLSARERVGNVRDAFVLRENHSNEVAANTILLLDDVCTTGATLSECARVLKQAGATEVFALTLARQL